MLSGEKILVVEDNPTTAKTIALFLGGRGTIFSKKLSKFDINQKQ